MLGFQRCIAVTLLFSLLTACGPEAPKSAFDRTVASTSENTDLADPETPVEPIDDSQTVGDPGDDASDRIPLFDKVLQNSDVSEKALTLAFQAYDANQNLIQNKKYITIFDIKQHSGRRRFYVINMQTGDVSAIHTSHGKNSDTDNDGYATSFSNTNGSNKSSLGFMLTAETYSGKHGLSLRLDGLESRNSNVRARAIVIHGASYVNPSYSQMGRSFGCPAVSDANRDWVINALKNGSLFYIYNEDYE